MRQFNLTISVLNEWFDTYNKEYFGNKLPKWKFEIKDNCSSYFGKCCYMDKLIRMSTYRDRDEWHFQQTLIHEMIHLYQFVNNLDLGHGISFKKKADEINRLGGWHIQRCSEDSSKAVNPKARKKRTASEYVTVFVWDNEKKNKCFSLVAKSSISRLFNWAKSHPQSYKNLEVYEANAETLSCFRKSNRLGYYDFSKYAYNFHKAVIRKISVAV